MALIYIVEDDENIREIEEFALRNAGFSVESFPNAANFFDYLEEKMPDLVLLDIMLPDESGNDIVKNLRASEITASIPVIMVTAKTTELDLARGLENGAEYQCLISHSRYFLIILGLYTDCSMAKPYFYYLVLLI